MAWSVTWQQRNQSEHCKFQFRLVSKVKSHLLEHLVLRLGPDVKLRRTDTGVNN